MIFHGKDRLSVLFCCFSVPAVRYCSDTVFPWISTCKNFSLKEGHLNYLSPYQETINLFWFHWSSNLNKVASEPGFPCIHTHLGKWGSRRGVLILEGFFFDIMAQGIRVCRLVQGITVCLWNLNREKHNITWHNIPYKKSWKLDVLLLCYLNRKHQKLFRRWNVCLLDLQKSCFHKHC